MKALIGMQVPFIVLTPCAQSNRESIPQISMFTRRELHSKTYEPLLFPKDPLQWFNMGKRSSTHNSMRINLALAVTTKGKYTEA